MKRGLLDQLYKWGGIGLIALGYMLGDRLYRANEALRRWPTHTWALGDIVRDEVDINHNPVTPTGEYPVVIGVMDSLGQPVGDKVACGRVTIQ